MNRRMPYLNDCKEILRRLIAKGDINDIPLAERATNEYLAATPRQCQKERAAIPARGRSNSAQRHSWKPA